MPNPELWVKAYADYLYQYAMKRVADSEISKDLVQETFLSAIKSLADFRGKSSEKTWLTSILKNKIIDHYRKQSIENFIHPGQGADNKKLDFFEDNGHWRKKHEPEAWGIEEINSLENKELKSILEGCIKKLPPQWFLVFSMKYLDGEDSEKICKELALTPSNFWVIIHRAKLSLRACISKHWLS